MNELTASERSTLDALHIQLMLTDILVEWGDGYPNAEPKTLSLYSIIGHKLGRSQEDWADSGFDLPYEFIMDLCDLNIGEQATYSDPSGDVTFTKKSFGKNG